MTRREGWFVAGTSAILVVSLWLIETLLPDLLGIPPRWAWLVVGLAAFAGLMALAARGLRLLRQRTPGPSLANPVWRSVRWVRERPRVSVLLAAPSAISGVSTLDALTIRLTVHRGVARTRRPCLVDFDDAVLILTQRRQGQTRVWRLRPVETGGFLSLPIKSGDSDDVVVDFRLMALPLASSQAPDLHQPFALVLDEVRATLRSARPVSGRLPKAHWQNVVLTP